MFCSGGDDGLLKIWDKRVFSSQSKPVGGFIGHHEGIVSADFKYNQPQICTSSKD